MTGTNKLTGNDMMPFVLFLYSN